MNKNEEPKFTFETQVTGDWDEPMHVYLAKSTWNDYGYYTLYRIVICDAKGIKYDLGHVKIANFGQTTETRIELLETFTQLDSQFFSLGQDPEYYANLQNLDKDLKELFLRSINDIAFNDELRVEALKEDVTKVSLLRNRSQVTIENQYKRDDSSLSGGYIQIIDLTDFRQVEKKLDNVLISICEGNTTSSLVTVKKRLLDFLEKDKKKRKTIEMGAVAEFFCHFILRENEFRQECLLFNLEEGHSIKKGFDGYYSKNNEEWIMESKSGSMTSQGISHISKIQEAYNGIKKMVEGVTSNNPWQNAYYHANLKDAGSADEIIAHLKTLADEYTCEVYHKIDEFNIIPCATLYLDNEANNIDTEKLRKQIDCKLKSFEYKKVYVVCITKNSIDDFINYLKKGLPYG